MGGGACGWVSRNREHDIQYLIPIIRASYECRAFASNATLNRSARSTRNDSTDRRMAVWCRPPTTVVAAVAVECHHRRCCRVGAVAAAAQREATVVVGGNNARIRCWWRLANCRRRDAQTAAAVAPPMARAAAEKTTPPQQEQHRWRQTTAVAGAVGRRCTANRKCRAHSIYTACESSPLARKD